MVLTPLLPQHESPLLTVAFPLPLSSQTISSAPVGRPQIEKLTGSFLGLQLPRPKAPQGRRELPPSEGECLAAAPGALASRVRGAAGGLADRAGRRDLVLDGAVEAAEKVADAARALPVPSQRHDPEPGKTVNKAGARAGAREETRRGACRVGYVVVVVTRLWLCRRFCSTAYSGGGGLCRTSPPLFNS